jgi:uncharacterized protein (TIGR02246 family)
MTPTDLAHADIQAVLACQQQFWRALERKDPELFRQVLAEDFVCHSPGQAQQQREAFVLAITRMPFTLVHVSAEELAVHLFDTVAVLTGIQVARLQMPTGAFVDERLALSNVFRQSEGQWRMALAHPVTLPNSG